MFDWISLLYIIDSDADEETKEKLAEMNGFVKAHKQCDDKISGDCDGCEKTVNVKIILNILGQR